MHIRGLTPVLTSWHLCSQAVIPARAPSFARMSARHASGGESKRVIKGVIFDMDGTLTVPNLDFKTMYARCGVDMSLDLLSEVAKMPEKERLHAENVIEEMEEEGRRTLVLMPGARELAEWIRDRKLPAALVSRNTMKSAQTLNNTHWAPLLAPAPTPLLHPLIGRDTHPPLPPKPDPAALVHIAQQWGVPPASLIMIGDSPANDIVAGARAGTATALLDTGRRYVEGAGGKGLPEGIRPDVIVERLADLPARLEEAFEIAA